MHSPSTVTYEVNVPKDGRLHFGMGITEKEQPHHFSCGGGLAGTVFKDARRIADAWEDADVDSRPTPAEASSWRLQTSAEKRGAVGLWANPLLTTKAPKKRPNVLIYMIDTLRADHTSLYGYARDTTPFLKKFGAAGLGFRRLHGAGDLDQTIRRVADDFALLLHARNRSTTYDTIPKGSATLAEQLRAAGIRDR